MRKRLKTVCLVWALLGTAFAVWLAHSYQAQGFDRTILENSPDVKVSVSDETLTFTPTKSFRKVFVFFPGALVDPEAYAPLCRQIAEHGIEAIIVKMPRRMAEQGYNKPATITIFSDPSKRYFLAGHSKGAAMAARFVHENLAHVDGLILMGTTHPKDFSLTALKIPVLKIYGLNDGVAKPEDVEAGKSRLPPQTIYLPIVGGNHSQFGYYGFQLGDHRADISRKRQQQIILDGIISLMQAEHGPDM